MAGESVFHVSLDRVEESTAVLVTRETRIWLLPEELLPDGASEGDVLRVTLEVDREETDRLASRISELQARLLERTATRSE